MSTTASPPILIWQPEGGVPVGPVSNPPVYSQANVTPLIIGQAYVDVVFGSLQTTTDWVLVECDVVNTVDLAPLNIWPGLITNRTTAGFRVWLNGMPDSANYYLNWAVSGINIAPSPATSYTLTGPSSGGFGVAATFTVALPPSTTLAAPVVVTPSDGGGVGVFSPAFVTLTTGSSSQTFTYTPVSYGAKTISTTNSGPLSNPASIVFTCVASTYTLSGPSSGAVGVASTNFTVALPVGGAVIGTVTVTPSAASGTFTPTTVALTTGAPSATFTYTPASGGANTLSVTNDGGLTNPGNLTYTAAVGFTSTLTVAHAQVPSTQTDFPVLVDVTNAVLKTVANGGNVQRSDGFDIGFYADSGGVTKLKWEMQRYIGLTGRVIAWVKIPSLSSSVDTVFYMRYGDPSITTDQSDPVNTWSNGFLAVYHFGTATVLNTNDSKGAFNAVTAFGTPLASTGVVDGSVQTSGGQLKTSAAPVTVPPLTISVWGLMISGGSPVFAGLFDIAGAWNGFYLSLDAGFHLQVTTVSNGFASFSSSFSSATANLGSFDHLAGVFAATNSRTAYLNGVAATTDTASVTPTVAPTALTMGCSIVSGAASAVLAGKIDELRVANVARSTNWLITEYNNQNAPGTFITFTP